MSRLVIYLLGTPRVERDGKELHIARRKSLALLAYLAVEQGRHSRDALATLLWPDYDRTGARGRLRRTLSSLNQALGEGWLAVDRELVGLNADADPSAGSGRALWLDVDQFRQRLAACEPHGHPASETCPDCLVRLGEAVELYRDDFMAGFTLPDSLAFDEWQFRLFVVNRHLLAAQCKQCKSGGQ